MIGGSDHYAICMACDPPTVTKLPSQDNLSTWVRDHRRQHLVQLRNRASTITVLYDAGDETDPWLSGIMNWHVNFRIPALHASEEAAEEQETDDPT